MNKLHPDLSRVIVSEEQIGKRVEELAYQLSLDYAHADRLYLIGILKGAFIFLADLARRLTIPHVVDFMAVSSYGATAQAAGAVRLLMDVREPLEGEHVLIVEDIVDTGQTVAYLNKTLVGRSPASIKTCAFLRKRLEGRQPRVDYLGFEIPDVWVVGYGLDYADRHRTLPFVAELKREVYQE
jgi:hypoxanthine phosphoribosyltransferase